MTKTKLPQRGTGRRRGNAGPRRNGRPRNDGERRRRHSRLFGK